MREPTCDGVRDILVDRLHIDVQDDETDLIDSGMLDSMSLVELFVALEEVYGIDVADEDLDLGDFRTVNTISGFVDRRVPPSP